MDGEGRVYSGLVLIVYLLLVFCNFGFEVMLFNLHELLIVPFLCLKALLFC